MVNKNKCIKLEDIGEELFYINGSKDYFITKNIEIYRLYESFGYYKMKQRINSKNGYVYCAVKYNEKYKFSTERVHRIVALTFIHNDDTERKLMVGHKNNIKHDNRIENLYWTTNQENTKNAFDDGLNIQPSGINSDTSTPIMVTDLNNNMVAVYGGIREAGRMIFGITESYISKTAREIGIDYTPRSRKYKYFKITRDQFAETNEFFKNLTLIENRTIKKQNRVFKATNLITGEEIISDNQKRFAKEHNLKQANISHCLLNKKESYEHWVFETIKDIDYTESSGYNNLIDTYDSILIKNIETEEELEFKNPKRLKDYFGFTGHDVMQYITRNNLIYSKWKIIKVNNQHI